MAIIDYNKAIQQANEIDDLIKQMDREIVRLDNLINQIKGEWCGPASEQFRNELLMLVNDMLTTRYSMSTVSNSIRTVANQLNVN